MQYHYHSDGSIDFDFYRMKAAELRSQAMQETGRELRQHGKTAAFSISAMFTSALGAMLDRMFPEEPPRPWAR
jgi:hypothetical protein